jgi:HTH-type transcriptional regulator/antitoxin HigA
MAGGKTTEARRKGTTGKAARTAVADRTYLDLAVEFPLRPIRTEEECRRATEIIDRLADRGEDDLSPGEADYLDVLSMLMERWEDEHVHIDVPKTVADRLRAYMLARDLSQADVVKGANVSPSTISELLAGKRTLGRQPATRLATFFRVPVACFLG